MLQASPTASAVYEIDRARKIEANPVRSRILEWGAQERDRVGCFGRADQKRGAEERQEYSPARTGGRDQPSPGEPDQTERDGERRPEQQPVDSARDSGVGMDEKRVVAAVAPAIQIE